jgi:CHAT domain-containing protein
VKQIEELGISVEPNAALRIEDLRQRVAAAEAATLRLVSQTSSAGPSSGLRESPPNARQVASLPEQGALVEFYFARGSIFAFLIAKGVCDLLPLVETRRVERLHRLVMFQLRTRPRRLNNEILRDSLMEHLAKLYHLLWSAIRPRIHASHLVIVPHGFLHQLPFHALFYGQQFLTDSYAVTYSPSAAVVLHATRRGLPLPLLKDR